MLAHDQREQLVHALGINSISRSVEVDGCPINYLCWNPDDRNKPGLLLLHGFCAHAHWWDFVAPALLAQYRVYAMDFSGMGDSGHRAQYSHALYRREIFELIETEKLSPVTLVGHSFGGVVSMHFAATYPDKVHTLTLVDSHVRFPDDPATHLKPPQLKPPVISPTLDQARARFRLVPPENCADGIVFDHVARGSIKSVDGGFCWKFDYRLMQSLAPNERFESEALSAIRCPVGYIYGEHSAIAPKSMVERAVNCLRYGCSPIGIEDSHHHVLLDQPLVLSEVLCRLLPELDAHRASALRGPSQADADT